MIKKIFRSIFLASSVIVLACLLIIMGVLFEYFEGVQQQQLAVQTALAAQGVETEQEAFFSGLQPEGYRLTWVAADGGVLYDSEADAAAMENHAGREEIKEALETGSGDSERYSDTVFEKTIYHAQRIADGSVVRVSVTHNSVWTLLLGMLQPILIIFVLALLLSFILARRLSRRIVEPLNMLDLDQSIENDTYEELAPLLMRIEQQRRQIKTQLAELKHKQDEFAAITEGMREGLVLIGKDDVVLSINRAALKLFAADRQCIGQNFLTVCRNISLQKLIDTAWQGADQEIAMELAGSDREYQFNAAPVLSNGQTIGVCLLTFDVTDKANIERIRREFTANVSHELKTPLHSILGAAELMANDLVKPEDMQHFIGRIRSEASRLVNLIDDIIRLSQLDESEKFPLEKVDLRAIVDEVKEVIAPEAAEKDVTVVSECADSVLKGSHRLIYEIVYNLCDNAVKYNTSGGQVTVTVRAEEEAVVLSVADTGIGIPAEHRERVFERFYRVDKSHSRATGGTGLGLSIVKHAADYHHAQVSIDSQPGQGTTITVRFPRG